MTVTISAIVPTAGRETLRRTLLSGVGQLRAGDEIIIAGDITDGPLTDTEAMCAEFGVRYVPSTKGVHDWGHSQINHAMKHARGDYLFFNDDDDIFTPDAFASIRDFASGLDQPAPIMFKFLSQYRIVIWGEPWIEQGYVGGHNFVVPNKPEWLGEWAPHYEGDFAFIVSTCAKIPLDVPLFWRSEVIAIARPQPEWLWYERAKEEATA